MGHTNHVYGLEQRTLKVWYKEPSGVANTFSGGPWVKTIFTIIAKVF